MPPLCCGCNVSSFQHDFLTYPINKAKDFYETCEFHQIEPCFNGLEKLASLGDIFIFEPTGSYSLLWHDNLLRLGKEVRLISHNKVSSMRGLCGWVDKDDEHDAVVCAYYGWLNLDNKSAFNRIRTPQIHSAYLSFLEKERLVKELRVVVNRAWNLMHREFPEALSKPNGNCEKPKPIWGFIAGKPISKQSTTRYSRALADSIGTAKVVGFSKDLIDKAGRIYELQSKRSIVKKEFENFLNMGEYQWLKPVFDKFRFSIFERCIFLCQFDPFEQFLDDRLRELRLDKKRRVTRSGKYATKRIGLARFHALMGKAIYPWSSGDKEGHIVSGSQLARNHLYLWVKREICLNANRPTNSLIQDFRDGYDRDLGLSKTTLTQLIALSDSELIEGLVLLEKTTIGQVLIPSISEAIKAKRSPIANLKQKGSKRLSQWAKNRVADRAVKVLFKKLMVAYRDR